MFPTLTHLLQVILFGVKFGFKKKFFFFNTHTQFYFRFLSSRDDGNLIPNQGIMSFITPLLLLPTLSHTHTAAPCLQTLLVCLSTRSLLHEPGNNNFPVNGGTPGDLSHTACQWPSPVRHVGCSPDLCSLAKMPYF